MRSIKGFPTVRNTLLRRSFFAPVASIRFLAPVAALVALAVASCGGGGSQNNPPPPNVVISVDELIDVGERYLLSGAKSTDPNGDDEDLIFQWRFVTGAEYVQFDDHCRSDFDEICFTNDDDHCSNDVDLICNEDSDCQDFGTCQTNSGTTSPDCTTGICGLEEGDNGVDATFVAEVAGPFTVRLSALGNQSNGTATRVVDTYPSLYVVGTLVEFGGTKGALIGPVKDSAEYATDAIQGVAHPVTGNLIVIDKSLELVRAFDLRTGDIIGAFGQVDEFVDNPAAITFRAEDNRAYVAEDSGKVQIFNGTTGLLISNFGNVGTFPIAMRFSPTTGDLLVVNGEPGAGVLVFGLDGTPKGVLGDTDIAVDEAVGIDFLGDDSDILIADQTGTVVRCDSDGFNCGKFSNALDNMLEDGSPSAVAVNPSSQYTTADVMIADPVGGRVITCNSNGNNCGTFGDTGDLDSEFKDIFFAPATAPTTTTTNTTTTTLDN